MGSSESGIEALTHDLSHRVGTDSQTYLKKFSPGAVLKRIRDAIDDLANEPRPDGVAKLQGADDLWRIRVGDYRIVYSINDGKLLVLVVRLGHRRDIYKN